MDTNTSPYQLNNTPLQSKYIDTDEYLAIHNIKQTIGEMVNSLLHEMDEHPYVFMVKYLSSKVPESPYSIAYSKFRIDFLEKELMQFAQ